MIVLATIMRVVQNLANLRSRAPGAGVLASHAYRYFADRHTLRKLARMSPHMIRDMGFDPDEVWAVANGEMRVSELFKLRLIRRQQEAEEANPGTTALPEKDHGRAPETATMPRYEPVGGECC